MNCPKCGSPMNESYDARTGKNRMFECDNCGNNQNAFDAYASTEGYPADKDEFDDWARSKGFDMDDFEQRH